MPRSWLQALVFVVPAIVILLVAALEMRRWLERRRRDREMAQALRQFLLRQAPERRAEPGCPAPPSGALPETSQDLEPP